jgi:DNA-binding transcriptional LysR family regulator
MASRIDWDARIGRRLRLRDLHIFFAVVQARSMAKAATQLRVTQPSVSKAISDLESALRVRLFDRSPQGVEPTMYGHALLTCGAAVFDELKQGIRNLMSLSIVLRARLLAAGPYLTVFANSVMRLNADRYGLVVLPIDLPNKPWPVVIVSLKNRTLSPLVERFIACAREVAQSVADTSRTRKLGGRLT